MNNPIAVSEQLQNTIAKKVRDIFGELIPEEKFNEYVQSEIQAFFSTESTEFTVKEEKSGYVGSVHKQSTLTSPFRLLVWKEVRKLVDTKLKELMESESMKVMLSESIDSNGYARLEGEISDMWEKKFEQMTQVMTRNMFRDMMVSAVNNAKMEIMGTLSDKNDPENPLNPNHWSNY